MAVNKAIILLLTTLLTVTNASPLTPASSPTPTTSSPPSSTTCPPLCRDYVNECGQWYGGCVEHYCPGDPLPEYEDPGCPPSSPASYPEATIDNRKRGPEPTTTGDDACPTVCVDAVNKCGMGYGGCVPHCSGEPLPTFSPPPCPEE